MKTTQNSKKRNFVLQQGFQEMLSGDGCSLQYAALQFQPRVILVWLMAATVLQSPLAFVSLSAVLWWSALLPRLNPFDAVYNMALGRRAGAFRISRAPAPRRTAQAIAGGLALVSATLIYAGLTMAAYGVEALFVAAVLALTSAASVWDLLHIISSPEWAVRPQNPSLGSIESGALKAV